MHGRTAVDGCRRAQSTHISENYLSPRMPPYGHPRTNKQQYNRFVENVYPYSALFDKTNKNIIASRHVWSGVGRVQGVRIIQVCERVWKDVLYILAPANNKFLIFINSKPKSKSISGTSVVISTTN